MKLISHRLLIWCLPLWESEFYLTVNIIDILSSIIFILNATLNKGYTSFHFAPFVEILIDAIFLVYATAILIIYFVKSSFATKFHFFYMISRYFARVTPDSSTAASNACSSCMWLWTPSSANRPQTFSKSTLLWLRRLFWCTWYFLSIGRQLSAKWLIGEESIICLNKYLQLF